MFFSIFFPFFRFFSRVSSDPASGESTIPGSRHWDKEKKTPRALLFAFGEKKQYSLGYCASGEDASRARDAEARRREPPRRRGSPFSLELESIASCFQNASSSLLLSPSLISSWTNSSSSAVGGGGGGGGALACGRFGRTRKTKNSLSLSGFLPPSLCSLRLLLLHKKQQ